MRVSDDRLEAVIGSRQTSGHDYAGAAVYARIPEDRFEACSMSYSVSWPENTFLAVFVGTITADEIEAVNHAFSGDERMETIRYSIWTFRALMR